ncbi:hypothetical protein GCM10020000_61310 [Streptomyces olivoverticillatus]
MDGEVDGSYGGESAEAHGDAGGGEEGRGGGASDVVVMRSVPPPWGGRWGGGGGGFVEFELLSTVGDDAFGAESHEEDEGDTEGEELVVLEELEFGGDEVEEGGAEEGGGR